MAMYILVLKLAMTEIDIMATVVTLIVFGRIKLKILFLS